MKRESGTQSPLTLLESNQPTTLAKIKESLQEVFMPGNSNHGSSQIKIGLSVDYNPDEGVQADAKEAWGYTIPKTFDAIKAIGADDSVEVVPLWHELMFQYMQFQTPKNATTQLAAILREYEINAIVIPGNEFDIHPKHYDEPLELTTKLAKNSRRTEFELLLAKVCTDILGIPILGICGGAHVITVSAGGKLTQEIAGHNYGGCGVDFIQQSTMLNVSKASLVGGAILKLISNAPYSHHLRTDIETLKQACQASELDVEVVERDDFFVVKPTNCAHHQAIKIVPESLEIIGLDAKDKNIELIENAHRGAPVIGVQFHPEVITCDALDEETAGFGSTYTSLHTLYFSLIVKAAKSHTHQQHFVSSFNKVLADHPTYVAQGCLQPSLFSAKNHTCADDASQNKPGLA